MRIEFEAERQRIGFPPPTIGLVFESPYHGHERFVVVGLDTNVKSEKADTSVMALSLETGEVCSWTSIANWPGRRYQVKILGHLKSVEVQP